MRASATRTTAGVASARRGTRGVVGDAHVVDDVVLDVALDASEDESDCDSLCVDALLVSSSDDEDEEDDGDARLSRMRSVGSSFMARSMGEASEEAVSALVRKVSHELERSATLEVETREEEEEEEGREDRCDDVEGLARVGGGR
jgi:hypothetical protein